MRRIAGYTVLPSLALLVLGVFAAQTYISVMYDGRVTRESAIEAVNFTVQTITTVGYGNWESPAIQREDLNRPQRVLRMRLWSIPFMLFGATAYAVVTGVFVALLLPSNR